MCSSFFSKAMEGAGVEVVRAAAGANWLQPTGPNGPIPRKTAWMVYFDCTCTYSTFGRGSVEFMA